MVFSWDLKPWIFDTVFSEKQKHLAVNSSHATSSSCVKVDCTEKQLVQILNFGGGASRPSNDSLSPTLQRRFLQSLQKRKQEASGRNRAQTSITHGSNHLRADSLLPGTKLESPTWLCILNAKQLFDPTKADGVTVDIHELLYRGGACMLPIGKPQRLSEQEGARQSARAMTSPTMGSNQPQDDEPMSSQVFSQTRLLSYDDEEDIATQIPRNTGEHDKSHHTRGGAMATGNLLNALKKSFEKRKATSKRSLPSGEASPSPERARKRKRIVPTPRRTSSPLSNARFEKDGVTPEDEIVSQTEPAQRKRVHRESISGIQLPLHEVKVAVGVKASEVESRTANGRHNKAVQDNFHIGLKMLSQKFVSPPKAQLQYLSINARHIDPRLPEDEQHIGLPPHIILELSTLNSALSISTGVLNAARSQDEDLVREDTEPAVRSASQESESKLQSASSPSRPKGYPVGEIQQSIAELSDVGSNVSWVSTVRGSPGRQKKDVQMEETSPELSLVKSQEPYLGAPIEEEDDEDEEPGSSPIRLPSPQAATLPHFNPSTSLAYKSRPGGQLPSSSLSIDYELEQEWPMALISSSAPFPMHSRSPTPVPKITALTTAHPPMLQIERSPSRREINRRAEKSLFRATITRDDAEISKADTRAVSSDPIIPATCVDSQETTTPHNVSQEEALHSVVSISGLADGPRDRVLVPATIPAKAISDSHIAEVVNSSNSETRVVPGTIAAVGSQTPSLSLPAEGMVRGDRVVGRWSMEGEPSPSHPAGGRPDVEEPSISRKPPYPVPLVAADFSQLSSSVTTAEMAKANGRSLLAQLEEHGVKSLRATAPTTMSDSKFDGIDRHAGDRTSPSEIAGRTAKFLEDSNTQNRSHPGANEMAVGCPKDTTVDSLPSPNATIFDRFKLEYPEFRYQRSKFVMACTYINWLQNNRKVMPVHQFLWDDFIRIFCGPYSDHVRNEKDEGGHTESPVDFYNNKVTSPVFHSNIVTQKTLPLVLSSDPDLTRKHAQRLRRISTNSMAHSESTTPREQRAGDMAESFRSAQPEAGMPHIETPAMEERRPRLAPPCSLILSEPFREEDAPKEVDTITAPRRKNVGARCTVQTAERREPQDIRRPLGAFVTPRNARIPVFATLTRGNNTPTKLSHPLLDPVERDVKSSYVPMVHKSQKGRSRYSLPRPESIE